MQVVHKPRAVVSSSFDKRVLTWTHHGRCLGSLEQGHVGTSSTATRRTIATAVPWVFQVRLCPRVCCTVYARACGCRNVHCGCEQPDNIGRFEALSVLAKAATKTVRVCDRPLPLYSISCSS